MNARTFPKIPLFFISYYPLLWRCYTRQPYLTVQDHDTVIKMMMFHCRCAIQLRQRRFNPAGKWNRTTLQWCDSGMPKIGSNCISLLHYFYITQSRLSTSFIGLWMTLIRQVVRAFQKQNVLRLKCVIRSSVIEIVTKTGHKESKTFQISEIFLHCPCL